MIAETIREQMAKTIQYVQPVPYGSATGLTAEVYEQMQADFMPAPLVALHSPVPEVMAGVWSMLRETIEDFQYQYLDDASLIAVTAWASFTAARHVSIWLAEPFVIAEGV